MSSKASNFEVNILISGTNSTHPRFFLSILINYKAHKAAIKNSCVYLGQGQTWAF